MLALDLFACDEKDDEYNPGRDGMERLPDITVDSGAGLPVANPKHFPGIAVRPSEGSRRGQKFMGPGGDLIPNQGQMSPEVLVESGDVGKLNFAAAEVRKPLLAVSAVNKKGSACWFEGAESFIIPKGATELPQIRSLIKQVRQKIRMYEKNGTFTMRVWRKPSGPFQGPGW